MRDVYIGPIKAVLDFLDNSTMDFILCVSKDNLSKPLPSNVMQLDFGDTVDADDPAAFLRNWLPRSPRFSGDRMLGRSYSSAATAACREVPRWLPQSAAPMVILTSATPTSPFGSIQTICPIHWSTASCVRLWTLLSRKMLLTLA